MSTVRKPRNTPDMTSSDFDYMAPYWATVHAFQEGTQAMRDGGVLYLPKFEDEPQANYDIRLGAAVFTNLWQDIVENLVDRPFSQEVQIVEASDAFTALCEDIDGQGNNLTRFAKDFFTAAVSNAIDWIYVDYTKVSPFVTDASGAVRRKSVAEEKVSGARPYWVHVPATEMIAVYSIVINGQEEYVHCRMMETTVQRAGWEEITVTQVREINREPIEDAEGNIIALGNATYRIWQQRDQRSSDGRTILRRNVWTIIDEGEIDIGVIPIVPLVIGKRKAASWRIIPAMRSVFDKQLEYYEEENGLKNVKTLTAFPMLSASGVDPEIDEATKRPIRAPVGPGSVLYGPPSDSGAPGVWSFIEPAAQSLTFLRNELKELEKQIRELGRQPLTQQTGNITSITSASANAKGLSLIQSWALSCKDALENAAFLTALWMGDQIEPTLKIFTDFSLDSAADDGFDHIEKMRGSGDMSQKTYWAEARRRSILSDEFDPEEELKLLEEEEPTDEELDATLVAGQIDPRTGLPFVPKEPPEDEDPPEDDDETPPPTE